MLYRYLPIGFADIGFIRDADSRIIERDRWCISEFLNSSFSYHIIRDHYWHKEPIMGGIFGWKKQVEIDLSLDSVIGYSQDMAYLKQHLYPLIKSDSLIHTNNHAFCGEHVQLITIPHKDQWDFIGNVIWNSLPKFQYQIGNIIQQNNDNKVLRIYSSKFWNPNKLKFGFMPPHPSIFLSRDIFQKFGLYNLDFKIGADYELIIRVFLKNNISWRYSGITTTLMLVGGLSSSGYSSYNLISMEIQKALSINTVKFSRLKIQLRFIWKLFGFIKR